MIIITGAYGFIGSCLVSYFNKMGHNNIIAVDDFNKNKKYRNLENKLVLTKINRGKFEDWLNINGKDVSFVIHIGARTDTSEKDYNILEKLNIKYSKMLWEKCIHFDIPLIYASSAATYGGGENGFSDSHTNIKKLKPLNPYGESKNDFDNWVLGQKKTPKFWAGLKFFNVYGPNEYHKGRMASVIFHLYNQIKKNKIVNLFRSHNHNFANGEQRRDFIYVKDLLKMVYFLYEKSNFVEKGIYNIGTGNSRTFNDLAKAIFKVLNINFKVNYIDTPQDIRDNYQYFTEAKMEKIIKAGYKYKFTKLEDGIDDYINNYLEKNEYI